MAESELSKRLTKLIKAGDKLVGNIKKDTENAIAAFKELQGLVSKDEDEKDRGAGK